ncbi:TrbI/VirB10 family protein [Sphingobium sp. AN558]|uniref:TrbI/VirB10 family protein n=1 Tax=Sphingobium sp. AN558 TaxID=3133442 RepID=UPI0030BF62BE
MIDAAEPVHDRRGDLMPEVVLPSAGPPSFLVAGMALILAIGLFLFLDARRRGLDAEREVARTIQLQSPPPPLTFPPAPPPLPAIVIREGRATPREPAVPIVPLPAPAHPAVLPGETPYPAAPRSTADGDARPATGGAALVIDLTAGTGVSIVGATPAGGDGGVQSAQPNDDGVRATLIRNRTNLIPQGAILAAVLETPLNSDRPGLARAIISEDARGFDGTRILIPRGSRLIGEFRSDGSPNLKRVLVNWTRLVRPDGVAMRIGSPSADPLGGAGIAGRVNNHFVERFAGAVLQSALTIGVNLASQRRSSGDAIYVGLPAQASQMGQQFAPGATKPPTVKVRAGVEVTVLVARDLDFSGTPAVR